MSATSLLSPSRYSSISGSCHTRSPAASAAASKPRAQAWSFVSRPEHHGPRATTQADGRVREVDDRGRLLPAVSHAEEGAHAHLGALRAVVDLEAEPALLGDLRGRPGQVRRVDVVGGRVDEIAREPGGGREPLA